MTTKHDFEDWVEDALRAAGGEATITEISRHVWQAHEQDLRDSGDVFFTWQYDVRWALQRLKHRSVVVPGRRGRQSLWKLVSRGA